VLAVLLWNIYWLWVRWHLLDTIRLHCVRLAFLIQPNCYVTWVRWLVILLRLVDHDVLPAALGAHFAVYEFARWWLRAVFGSAHLRKVDIMHPVVLSCRLDWVCYWATVAPCVWSFPLDTNAASSWWLISIHRIRFVHGCIRRLTIAHHRWVWLAHVRVRQFRLQNTWVGLFVEDASHRAWRSNLILALFGEESLVPSEFPKY